MTNSAASYQVELLKSDIEDVQNVILDVISRVGPLRQTSWKYPDSNGYEVNIPKLLQQYNLTDEDDEELIIQTALLELLIDRFLLLLHALSCYVDQRAVTAAPLSESDPKLSSKSAGLTTRQYWRKVNSLLSFVTDLQKGSANKDAKISELEVKLTQKTDFPKPKKMTEKIIHFQTPKPEISLETSVKGTQTLDTAFRPCESCGIVQEGLRSVLECVSSLVTNQHVPSSVAKFKKNYDGMTWLSATDLQRLVPELSCDLDKIQRQWSWLFSQLDPLRLEIDSLTKELTGVKQELQRKTADLSNINSVHDRKMRDSESRWMSADKENKSKIVDLRQRNERLTSDKEQLTQQVESLEQTVKEKQQLLEDLERLQTSFDGLSTESQVINQHLVAVTSERDSLRSALNSTKEELNRSKMLAESMRSRCEGFQSKQDSLLEQMTAMDKGTDDYRIKLSNLEGQLDAIREHLDDKRHEVEVLKQEKVKMELEIEQLKKQQLRPPSGHDSSRMKVREQEQLLLDLNSKMGVLQKEVAEYREKEMLLLAFPDPNGPLPFAQPSGNICTDLERQITATEVRAHLLQNQASQLTKSLKKLRETQNEQASARFTVSEQGPRLPADQESSSDRPSSASNASMLFSKRSTTFVVKPQTKLMDESALQDVDGYEQDNVKLTKANMELSLFSKTSNGKPIQLWRVPSQKEEEDPVSSALAAYAKQNDGLPPARGRSNSYGKPDARHEEAIRLARVKHDATLALPQLPNLPTCSAAAVKPEQKGTTTTSGVVSRAANRQLSIAAEIRLKTRISSAGKQRTGKAIIPPQPPSSPYAVEHDMKPAAANNFSNGDRLNWDLFSCSYCSKTYSNQRDLDIHSAYCNTGL